MRQRLTQELVTSLPADGRDRLVFDSLQSGFGIRVTPAGAKIFVAHVRVGGRLQRTSLGQFPTITVAAARDAARIALRDMRAGRDPKLERVTRERSAVAGATTVATFAERWLNEVVRPKRKAYTIRDYERLLGQKIIPSLGHLSVQHVTKEDVLQLHLAMKDTPRRANYTVSTFRALMTYAEDCGLRPPLSNPARRVEMYRERARERFLSEDEIGRAADAIDAAERNGTIGPHAAAGLRLALFTGARSGEITAIQWSHIDWDRKLIRLPDSKTNEPRTIHLPEAAVQVLKTTPRVGSFVIAGVKDDDSYKNLSRAWIKTRKLAGLDDVRLHDLRHSYASLAAGRGISLQMIGKLLGHRVPATTQRYAHLARDAVSAVSEDIGATMVAAMDRRPRRIAGVANLSAERRRRRCDDQR
jgi:integrase